MRYLLFLLIFPIGCYTPKKAEKQLDKANERYPSLVAEKLSKWYPCKDVEIKTDSSAYKKWKDALDSVLSLGKDTVIVTDTDTLEIAYSDCVYYKNKLALANSQLEAVKKKIQGVKEIVRIVPAVHDTIVRLDSTQIVLLTNKLNESNKEKDKYKGKYDLWFKFGISFLILLLISVIFNILKYRL